MELVFGFLGVIGVLMGIKLVITYSRRAINAAGRAAIGKGSLSSNMQAALPNMGQFQVRFNDFPLGEGPDAGAAKEIQIKGLLPFNKRVRLGFVTSIFDKTSGKFEKVISRQAEFQEQKTYVYQHRVDVGDVDAGFGFVEWKRAGVVLPQILTTPYGGQRKCVVLLRLIDLDDPPIISDGVHGEGGNLLGVYQLEFDFQMRGAGYHEVLELRDEARAICVQIAVYVAVSDGILQERQGHALKSWMKKAIDLSIVQRRDALKERLNTALKSAYLSAKENSLSLSDLTRRLAEIGDAAIKYELVELCYEIVMMADVGDARIVERIAKSLNLELSEIEKIRDIKIIGHADFRTPIKLEQLLGIKPEWDREAVKKHLRNEFQKWNNRVTTLPEGEEGAVAQRMLDAISEARKTYG